ncbi:hypothetical protein VZT92_006695 [Zoarces viviparus]
MVQNSAVVVPDIETVTCVHEEYSEPVNIEKVTQEMCRTSGVQNYVIAVVVMGLVAAIVSLLLVKCCKSRKPKHIRSFNA